MRKPNFFIIGAPKCGTTSLAAYLSEHPAVFMCKDKEPHFFSSDMSWTHVRTLPHYLNLFKDASDTHKCIGEASTSYLYSRVAVPKVLDFNPAARFIVMLRNPVDMVRALHSELLFSCQESEQCVERAWELQDERKAGRRIPVACRHPEELQYRDYCLLGEQVQRLLQSVKRERVHIVLLDEFRVDAAQVYRNALRFLEIDDDGRQSFPVHNQNKVARSRVASFLLHGAVAAKTKLEYLTGLRSSFGILSAAGGLNVKPSAHIPISPAFRAQLEREFKSDIMLLSSLLDRDLSYWIGAAEDEPMRRAGYARESGSSGPRVRI